MNAPAERSNLQSAGAALDAETKGRWVAEALRAREGGLPLDAVVVLDCARTRDQVAALREAYGERMRHVHLKAARFLRARRYDERREATFEDTTFEEASEDATERAIPELAGLADVVIGTDALDGPGILARAVAGLGLLPGRPTPLVDVLVGAQYGSEGKGNICAHLARRYGVLMRVGGPNAGHMVADPPYKYVQLPSGTQSNTSARILVGAGATLWLPQLLKEIADCRLGPDRLSIDPQAMVIEPEDREIEERGLEVIGSTKQGVGAATARKILNRGTTPQFGAPVRLARHVRELKDFVRCTKRELEKAYADGVPIMLEGTQGTDLSLHHGPHPHVTSRDTTASGCLADAGIAPHRVRRVIMVTRTYPIRVGGTSGPMMREIDAGTIAARSGLPAEAILKTEVGTVSGKARRIGEFDWEQLRRAAVLNGATDVALTFADYLDTANAEATTFEQLSEATRSFIAEVAAVANAPVTLVSVGFETAVIENGFDQ
ncbi:adenylosuccinate synthetase [Methylobacterium sp. B1]|uniref:adenylosuccinate synthetase n=1 Tax=Methylobacterium sp. B1 TaxID=91459 RepID=UPI002072B339|nr:adenylosuccinate synthetase [Methylobacterium sp. B1]